jgi:uncharacterized DUF497 family protein
MDVTFDPAKDTANFAKHGVSLADAASIMWDRAVTWPDQRQDYGEPRMIALAPIGQRLHCVVFVDRDKTRRIVSLRRANQREFDWYEAQTETD